MLAFSRDGVEVLRVLPFSFSFSINTRVLVLMTKFATQRNLFTTLIKPKNKNCHNTALEKKQPTHKKKNTYNRKKLTTRTTPTLSLPP
jgi:hypothetical protein